jgi:hypothetical protein
VTRHRARSLWRGGIDQHSDMGPWSPKMKSCEGGDVQQCRWVSTSPGVVARARLIRVDYRGSGLSQRGAVDRRWTAS